MIMENTQHKTRTVLVVSSYFPPDLGGVARYAYESSRRLHNRCGWKVVVVASTSGPDCRENVEDMEVRRLSATTKISNTPVSLNWIWKLRKIIKEVKPDIINIHAPVAGMSDLASLLAGKIPTVVMYHTGTMLKGEGVADKLIGLYEKVILPLMLKKARLLIASSDYVKFGILKDYVTKTIVLPTAVDNEKFVPDESLKRNEPSLLFVASLMQGESYKGLHILLKALVKIKERVPDIHLSVVGDGSARKKYEQMAYELGVARHVEFHGKLMGDALVREYQKADIFVLPTANDSYPAVILEAMSCGLPVVSTAVGSIPQVIDGELQTGVIVNPITVRGFAEAIIELIEHPEKYYALAAHTLPLVERSMSWSKRIVDYDAVLKNALQASPCVKQAKAHQLPFIAQVSALYPPHLGGMEAVVQITAAYLHRDGFPVEVFTSDIGSYLKVNRSANNFPVHRLASWEIAHTVLIPQLFFKLLSLPARSILHWHAAQAFVPEVVWLVSKLRGFPIIAHFHLDVEPSGKAGWLLPFYQKYFFAHVLRSSAKVLVFSSEQAQLVNCKYNVAEDKMQIMTNGVSEKFFHRPENFSQGHLAAAPLRIICVGRLTVQKRMDKLIEAMGLIDFPATLEIAGDGEDQGKLQALVRARGLEGRVRLVGRKDGKDLVDFYCSGDVFAIASDKEGMPLTVLEAMASGLPIVGSNTPGVREIVSKAGIIVEDSSPRGFAAVLSELWKHPQRLSQLSQQSQTEAQKHTWSQYIHQLEKVYLDLDV